MPDQRKVRDESTILSRYSLEDLKKESITIGTCDTALREVAKLKDDMIVKLVVAPELPVGHPNVFWGYCKADNECVPLKKSCNNTKGVNKKYQSNLENYINDSQNRCDRKQVTGKISKCVENFCSYTKDS